VSQLITSESASAVAEAGEPVTPESDSGSAVAEAGGPVTSESAKVYGAGPIQTGPPAIGARARRHVPQGASKWHNLHL
jgi:hypothetical protein